MVYQPEIPFDVPNAYDGTTKAVRILTQRNPDAGHAMRGKASQVDPVKEEQPTNAFDV